MWSARTRPSFGLWIKAALRKVIGRKRKPSDEGLAITMRRNKDGRFRLGNLPIVLRRFIGGVERTIKIPFDGIVEATGPLVKGARRQRRQVVVPRPPSGVGRISKFEKEIGGARQKQPEPPALSECRFQSGHHQRRFVHIPWTV